LAPSLFFTPWHLPLSNILYSFFFSKLKKIAYMQFAHDVH
jgi:hypothetical protein